MSELKYKEGDKVRIKSLDWYNRHAKETEVNWQYFPFSCSMTKYCGQIMTISIVRGCSYSMIEDDYKYAWTDEMIDCLVERNGKTYPYKVGDRVLLKGSNRCATITDLKYNSWGNLSYYVKIDNDKDISIDYPTDLLLPYDNKIKGFLEEETIPIPKFKVGDKITNGKVTLTILTLSLDRYVVEDNFGECGTLYFNSQDEWKIVEEECPQDFIEKYCKSCGTQRCDRTKEYLNGCPYYNAYLCKKQNNDMEEEALKQYEVPTGSIKIWDLPSGYIFKDERGNEIHATKIVLEKANTLKIQSDNMETETHRGYCTTEEETTNESKKVALFTFWDNDFADKVELDLSNRELIQEDGKWFVVKKKEYPKTYEECLSVLEIYNGLPDVEIYNAKPSECKLFESFIRLKRCRDAYWKLYGEEMGLGKPWKPSKDKMVYSFYRHSNEIETDFFSGESVTFEFPTAEMRDFFKNNFDPDIEFCKELL